LPDGSRVWLNAASSLRFPTAFMGGERNVELTGEAYFEIEKNREKPFHVLVNGMQVEVLGTHFDIMAYDDEAQIKTSLLEGRVSIREPGGLSRESGAGSRKSGIWSRTTNLLPGQQASLDKGAHTLVVDKDANMDKAVAWKNGLFDFEEDDITSIMRQLARWYDMTITYEGNVDSVQFEGILSRKESATELLDAIAATGEVHFKIEGNHVTVIPGRGQ